MVESEQLKVQANSCQYCAKQVLNMRILQDAGRDQGGWSVAECRRRQLTILFLPAVLALSDGDRALEKHWLRLLGPAGAKFIGFGPSGGSGLLKSVYPLGVFPRLACVIV